MQALWHISALEVRAEGNEKHCMELFDTEMPILARFLPNALVPVKRGIGHRLL